MMTLKDNYLAKHYIKHDVRWRAKKYFSLYWTLNVQPYLLIFAWKVIHNILPMNKLNLYCRKIISSFSSEICGDSAESMTHEIWECSEALEV